MKKFVTFLFLTTAILFTSCSSDDDNNDNNSVQARLVGTWKLTQQGAEFNGQELLFPYMSEAPECGDDAITFNANATGNTTVFYLNLNDGCEVETFPFTYTTIGETSLVINDEGEVTEAEILTLNNTTLKLKIVDEFDGETEIVLLVLTKV